MLTFSRASSSSLPPQKQNMCISKTAFFSELCITRISSLHLARLHSANWHSYLHQQSIESQAKVMTPWHAHYWMYLPKSNLHINTHHKSLFVILLTHIITQKIEETSLITNPIFQAHNHPKSFLWDISPRSSPLLPPSSTKLHQRSQVVPIHLSQGFERNGKSQLGPWKWNKKSAKGDERTELGNLPVCFFLPLVFGVRSTILVDPQKLYNWLVEWCTPLLFHLCFLFVWKFHHCHQFNGILRIQHGILIQLSPIDARDHHLPCDLPKAKENSNHPWWFVTGAGRIQKKTTSSEDHRFDPQGWRWWSPKGFISKHRLNSFGGLSLVCDWRYACRTLKPNGVTPVRPWSFFPARTWRRKMNFRPKNLFGIRPTDLFSGWQTWSLFVSKVVGKCLPSTPWKFPFWNSSYTSRGWKISWKIKWPATNHKPATVKEKVGM